MADKLALHTRKVTRDIPALSFRAAIRPNSVDDEARTVELVWTTGAPVLRRDFWDGDFYEELSLDAKDVRMGRLQNGAPLLDSHNGWSLDGVLGVVESARIETGQGVAVVRFARAEDDKRAEQIFRKVKDGILPHVSVGYRVYRYEKTEEEGKLPVFRATDWEPYELSLVPMGADDAATVRAKSAEKNPCEFLAEERQMPKKNNDPQGGAPATVAPADEERSTPEVKPEPVVDLDKVRAEASKEAALAERARVEDIRRIAQTSEADEDTAKRWIDSGISADEARKEGMDLIAKRRLDKDPQQEIRNGHVEIGEDLAHTGSRAGLANALLHRHNPEGYKLTDAGRMYRALTLMEMARMFLEANGTRTHGWSKRELATRALGGVHSTSDFPLILADVAGKTLRRAYDEAPATYKAWCRRSTLPDFKAVKRTQLGDAPQLKLLPEGSEIESGSIGEGKEEYSLQTYARAFVISRKTLINDDLQAFTRLPEMFGRRARELESDLVYAHLLADPTMGDSNALFAGAHNNTGAGTIGIAGLSTGRKKMRQQTGKDGARISVVPKFLLVPTALETEAEQAVAEVLAVETAKKNVFAGKLTVLTEARLDDGSAVEWYLAADPMSIDTFEYGYLEGEEGVALNTEVKFGVGVRIEALLDFAVKAIDWRGLYQSDGVDGE